MPPSLLIINPTPAVQRRLVFEAIEPNAVNRAREVEVLASGKGMNCARAARCLGADPELLVFLGGEPGQWFRRVAEQEGIRVRAVDVAAETRTCTTLLESSRGAVTELVENAGLVSEGETEAYFQKFASLAAEADPMVLIGTLPPGAGSDLYARMLRQAAGRRVIVDTQGAALVEALKAGPWLVKPNRLELAAATGIDCSGEEGLRAAMARLHEMGARHLLITDGAEAAWFSDGRQVLRFAPPKVEAKNPIGSGDSVAAGLAVAVSRGLKLKEAIPFALRCGSANAAGRGYGRLEAAVLEPGRVG